MGTGLSWQQQRFVDKIIHHYLVGKLNYTVVPIDLTSKDYLIVKVRINQSPLASFLLDTGSPAGLMSIDYAKKVDLMERASRDDESNDNSNALKAVQIKPFILTLANMDTFATEFSAISFRYIQVGTPIDGIIGLDWLKKHKAIIDIANSKLYFRSS
jgi:hypothetical protein